ncbi:uncharacterized protein LOC125381403 isoform X2 [Haliotis rufescens]|uniref:uncharacterized protein LOC125381403 isoform X2 n=1 Tax=Haliotis rufescens TaxID=6454 RepID=UPI00201F0E32|nr:uncharacterized protein LOC125381403 isoform X2 [Haliotis rufescens]
MEGQVQSDPAQAAHPFVVNRPKKSVVEAYILALVLGLLGAHHFYLRRPGFGLVYFFTVGLLGVGYVVDLFRLPCLVTEANRRSEDPHHVPDKTLCDAYVLWFPMGLFGFHLFYLGKPGQGILYLLTFGLCGIGFLVDLFRIPSIVKAANQCPREPDPGKTICMAYSLAASPLGVLGFHHYYLNRPIWGILYTSTIGLMGVGWIYDWFRIPILVKRANAIKAKEEDEEWKHLDDVYILWFPFGCLGLHHFYLNRLGWGALYFFTLGMLGFGWLVDFCRLQSLLKDHNKYLSERRLSEKTTQPSSEVGPVLVTRSVQTVVTVPNTAPGSVMTMPASGTAPPPGAAPSPGAAPPNGGMMPPPYGYQNMTSYPPQGYAGVPAGYPQGSGYPNQAVYPNLSDANAVGQTAPPMPPSYEEVLTTAAKPSPPSDVGNSLRTEKKSSEGTMMGNVSI